jgi:hypothetical protein
MKKFQNSDTGEWMISDKEKEFYGTEAEYKQKFGLQKLNQQTWTSPNQVQKQQPIQIQYQASLQLADDTWERLICALERLESVTENNPIERSANRPNFHRHRNEIPTDVYDAELEVHLQIKAFWRVVAPVRENDVLQWLLKDFICWLGGREKMQLNIGKADTYAIPVLKCIIGEKPNLTELEPPKASLKDTKGQFISPNKQHAQEVRETSQELAVGLEMNDKIVNDFSRDPAKKASKHLHERSSIEDGKARLKAIEKEDKQEDWLKSFFRERWHLIESQR